MTEASDPWATLLRAANAGDARAYSQFLQAVTPVMRGIVRTKGRVLGDAVCEDVVQDVLLAIHLKRHTWRSDAPLRPWLYAIARYKVVDAFRARGTRIDLPIEDFADHLAATPDPDPTDAADMQKMIAMLDPRAQAIVRKVGLDGASISETGQDLGMNEGAVRVALHRALKQLATLRQRYIE